MRILCLTHADFETPGIIQDWAKSHFYDFKIVRPYRGEDCLAEKNFDMLIVMGGPQSSVNIEDYTYLIDEVALIQKSYFGNKIILGFCLGAQLIGVALGAEAVHSPFKEIGVMPVTLTKEGKKDPLLQNMPAQFDVTHWHNDMPGLTENAVILAESEGCPRQIIRYDQNVYAFQCHLEITYRGMKDMIKNCAADLTNDRYVQDAKTLLDQDYENINNIMIKILDQLVALQDDKFKTISV
ncbi:MAG: homoserine O-succinyltransferase [Alphaproteobacteria bacterium]|nr:homoserine O-succinyltransferase [Alphaproteobacteria bacterium]